MRPTANHLATATAFAALTCLAPAIGSAQSFDFDLVGEVTVPDSSCTISGIDYGQGNNTSFTPQSNNRGRVDIQLTDENGAALPFFVMLDIDVNCGVAWQASITSQEGGLRNESSDEQVFIDYSAFIGTPENEAFFSTDQGANAATVNLQAEVSLITLQISGGQSPGPLLQRGTYSDTISLNIGPQ